MTKIYGPFDQGDFRTMQLLKDNIDYYGKKDPTVYADTRSKYRVQLKEFLRKVA
jgi:hypothetical protein